MFSTFPYVSLLTDCAHLHSYHHDSTHLRSIPPTHPPTYLGNLPPTHIPFQPSSYGLPKLHLSIILSTHPSTLQPYIHPLTHPCNLSPPTHMLTHSYNCLATHPIHLPIFPLPKNYPSHKLNIWVLFQHQRQPSFEKGLSLSSGCLVSSRPHSLSLLTTT